MAKKKGICKNVDGCDLAAEKTVQEADSSQFVCSECGKPLFPVDGKKTTSGGKRKIATIIVSIIAAIALIGGGAYFAFSGGTGVKDEPFVPIDTISTMQPQSSSDAESSSSKTDSPKSPQRELNLGYATYRGDLVNGKPDGNGVLEFSKDYTYKVGQKEYEIKAGEHITGMFRDGKLSLGTWYQKDGNETIIKR